jgi:uncharacterized membrane protein YqhA
MHRYLNAARYIAVVAVVCSFLGAVLMFVVGSTKSYEACVFFLTDAPAFPGLEQTAPSSLAMKRMVQAVDAFLFALVLMVFAAGVLDLRGHRPPGDGGG